MTMNIDELLSSKNITESSKNLYIKNLQRLNDGPVKNLSFLKNIDSVMEKIEKYKPNTQRSYIISIVSLLRVLTDRPRFKKLYDKYYEILLMMNKSLKTSNEKSLREKENWISQEEVLAKLDDLKKILPEIENKRKITDLQYNRLLMCVVLSLYALHPPRRNKDYQNMIITKIKTPAYSVANDSPNILDWKNKNFIFTNYKTKSTYQEQVIPIVPELQAILKVYFKFHKTYKLSSKPHFLVNNSGDNFKNNNDITRLLYKVFNKKIGSSMLRHIYLTDKYANSMDNLEQDATKMGTSTGVIQDHYIKED